MLSTDHRDKMDGGAGNHMWIYSWELVLALNLSKRNGSHKNRLGWKIWTTVKLSAFVDLQIVVKNTDCQGAEDLQSSSHTLKWKRKHKHKQLSTNKTYQLKIRKETEFKTSWNDYFWIITPRTICIIASGSFCDTQEIGLKIVHVCRFKQNLSSAILVQDPFIILL